VSGANTQLAVDLICVSYGDRLQAQWKLRGSVGPQDPYARAQIHDSMHAASAGEPGAATSRPAISAERSAAVSTCVQPFSSVRPFTIPAQPGHYWQSPAIYYIRTTREGRAPVRTSRMARSTDGCSTSRTPRT
jgi:hypothetical protein